MMKLKYLFLLVFVFSFSANASEIEKTDSNTLLFEVTKAGSDLKSYVFGTYHLLNHGYLKAEEPDVLKAYEGSEQVVVEVVMTQADILGMTQQAMMADGKTISGLLDDSVAVAQVDAELKASIGVPLQAFDALKPAYVTMTLGLVYNSLAWQEELAKYQGEPLDMFFQNDGKKQEKAVFGLETFQEQIDILFGEKTLEEQAAELLEVTSRKEEMVQSALDVGRSYFEEDMELMVNTAKQYEELMGDDFDYLLKDRNEHWIPQLVKILNDGNTFIAVGALHLPGEDGILKLLEKEGYIITPVL